MQYRNVPTAFQDQAKAASVPFRGISGIISREYAVNATDCLASEAVVERLNVCSKGAPSYQEEYTILLSEFMLTGNLSEVARQLGGLGETNTARMPSGSMEQVSFIDETTFQVGVMPQQASFLLWVNFIFVFRGLQVAMQFSLYHETTDVFSALTLEFNVAPGTAGVPPGSIFASPRASSARFYHILVMPSLAFEIVIAAIFMFQLVRLTLRCSHRPIWGRLWRCDPRAWKSLNPVYWLTPGGTGSSPQDLAERHMRRVRLGGRYFASKARQTLLSDVYDIASTLLFVWIFVEAIVLRYALRCITGAHRRPETCFFH